MKRLGQAAVAAVAVAGACTGGALALAVSSGPMATTSLVASPLSSIQALAGVVADPRTVISDATGAISSMPIVHAVTGASGGGAGQPLATTQQVGLLRTSAPATHGRSGASGATASNRRSASEGTERESD